MARLGETVAELVRRAGASPVGGGEDGTLPEVEGFGANPGALRMRLHVPAGLPPSAPLVTTLHGCSQTAAGYARGAGWIALADRFGFAVLAPEQTRANNANLCFNWFHPEDTARIGGEAESVAQMVRRATADHGLDPARVFVTGLSAGGAMAAAMLATYPELFAAGAVVAGLPYGAAAGMPEAFAAMRGPRRLGARAWGDKVRAAAPGAAAWPAVSIWQGEADATVAPSAADALVEQWTDVHGVDAAVETPTGAPGHRRRVWAGPDGRVRVERHDLAGMGHGTPVDAASGSGGGEAAPYLLEVGVASSVLIGQAWGIVPDPFPLPEASAEATAAPGAASGDPGDVAAVIARALRSAGLLR